MRISRRWTFGFACATLAWALPLTGCSTNPATGRSQFNLVGEDQEIGIGSQAAPGFLKEGGGDVPDAKLIAYVGAIGKKLAAASERPNLPWEFHVLNSQVINAFALPGGKVFITRGLLEKMSNEAQVAGVLGHEVGHVTAQHIGQQMSQAMVVQAGLSVAGAVSQTEWVEVLGGYGGKMYLLKFGRDQESQADELGLRYMTRLNYDPKAMLGVMQVLKAASGGGAGLEMLQTHPLPDTRIQRITDLLSREYAHTQNNPQYQLKAAEFQANILAPLKALPPPPKAPTSQGSKAASCGACGSGEVHRHPTRAKHLLGSIR